MNSEDVFFQLKRANPAPDSMLSPAEQARADETLAAIVARDDMGVDNRREAPRRTLAALTAIAAVIVLVLGVNLLPGNQPSATAQQYLSTAAQSAEKRPTVTSPQSRDYLRRVDRIGDSAVTSVLLTDIAGHVHEETTSVGPRNEKLEKLNAAAIEPNAINDAESAAEFVTQRYGRDAESATRGALEVLLTPGLHSDRQRQAYELLSGLEGITVVDVAEASDGGEDEIVTLQATVHGSEAELRFSLIPATGQLTRVQGLVAPGVETTVDAAGILGCVAVTGLGGPESLSLACADNNYTLNDLRWSDWGAPSATATGVANINNCDPDCAQGTREQFPVTVTAQERRSCGYNLDVYTRLTVAYPPEAKQKNPLATDETIDLGCGQ